MLQQMNLPYIEEKVGLMPWTEGYDTALGEKNTVIFSTARLPERKEMFKWVGPIAPCKNVFLAREDLSIKGQKDLKNYR